MCMLTLIIRAILVYLIVLIVFRLMGKRQLGQMQPFELVLTLVIADLATIPMAESSVPILHGLVPLFTLVTVHFFLALATRSSNFLNKVISGKPVIVVNPKGIDYQAIKNLNISVDDLFEAIRGCGFFSLDEVQYAIVETNGTVNVLPKKDSSPVTVGDLKETMPQENLKLEKLKEIDETTIPITLVAEGKINKNNLKLSKLNESKLQKIIKNAGGKHVKDILILTIDGNGKIYYQQKKGTFKTWEIDYSKEIV